MTAPVIHLFEDDLNESERLAREPWWEDMYRLAFPSFVSMQITPRGGWAQRGGIDRIIHLEDGTSLSIDEKVRPDIDWGDFFIEAWSNKEKKVRGWAAKDAACDYIAYVFIPSSKCYLIPFRLLRIAWAKNVKTWTVKYGRINVLNDGYTTVGVAVPIDVLMTALIDAMLVRWDR